MGLQQKTTETRVVKGLVPQDYDFDKEFRLEDYEPWLKGVVWDFLRKFSQNPRFDFNELMSEAWLALVESSKTFSTKVSNSLLGYAKPYILNRLKEFVSTNFYTLRVRYYNIKNNPEKLEMVNRQEALIQSGDAAKANSIIGDSVTVFETTPSKEVPIIEIVENNEELSIIKDIVNNKLNKKYRKAIVKRFKENKTYSEIGKDFGIGTESARTLVKKSLEALKKKAKNAGIKN